MQWGGPPLDNVKSVEKSIHLESVLHIGKGATNAKAWVTLPECAEPRILVGGHTPKAVKERTL